MRSLLSGSAKIPVWPHIHACPPPGGVGMMTSPTQRSPVAAQSLAAQA